MKKILALIMAACMVFSFAACQGKEVITPKLTDPEGESQVETASTPETVSESLVLLEDLSIPEKNNSGLYITSAFENMSKDTGNYKYILYEEIEGEKLTVSAVPEEDFKNVYEGKETPDYLLGSGFSKETDVFKSIQCNPEVILNNLFNAEGLLTNVPENGENTYLSFNNTGDLVSAFNVAVDPEKGLISQLKNENLNLVFSNITLKKLIGSDSMAVDLWSCCAVVDAEVTCIKNDGTFKDISWIPEKGSYKKVEFVILYMSYDNNGIHSVLVNDISASEIK